MITGQEQSRQRFGNPHRRDRSSSAMSTRAAMRSAGDKTVWEEISAGNDIIKLGKHEVNSRAYCGAFNFKGGDQQQKVGNALRRPAQPRAPRQDAEGRRQRASSSTNRPTTSIRKRWPRSRTRSEAFAGCAVIISHDRMFLDRPGHPHPRLRGRQPCRMVRRQLRRLRAGQGPPPRPGYASSPKPRDLQAPDALIRSAPTPGSEARRKRRGLCIRAGQLSEQ